MAKPTRKKSTHRRRRRRRKHSRRGGGPFSSSLTKNATSLALPPFEPPGGMYKPGGVNGLDGGYYYGVNVDPSLPDPISTSALFRQPSGSSLIGGRRRRKRRTRSRKRRRTRRKHRRRRRKRRTHRRKHRRRRRKRRTHRRRGQRGGLFGGAFSASGSPLTALKKLMTTVTPKDALDVIYNSGNKVGNLYRGYVGERPKISPNATVQPIDQGTRTLSYQPLDANTAYQNSINTVNTRNTPVSQSQYS